MWAVLVPIGLLRPGIPSNRYSPRTSHLRAAAPIDGLKGIDLQRKLGEGSFSEVIAGDGSAAGVLSGRSAARASAVRVQVGLFYGQLTKGDAAGTRVLVKAVARRGFQPRPGGTATRPREPG